jgi:hypothetical protein
VLKGRSEWTLVTGVAEQVKETWYKDQPLYPERNSESLLKIERKGNANGSENGNSRRIFYREVLIDHREVVTVPCI